MKITKQVREYISLSVQALEAHGIEWQIEISSRHSKLLYWISDQRFFATLSNSTSDNRARLNLKSDVMKNVRQHHGGMK